MTEHALCLKILQIYRFRHYYKLEKENRTRTTKAEKGTVSRAGRIGPAKSRDEKKHEYV